MANESTTPGTGIDEVITTKIQPLLDLAMHQYLGVTVEEIKADISDRLKTTPFFDPDLHTDKPYKKAKELARGAYLVRLLRQHFGNVSIAARIAGLDRRSVHRLIEKHKINVGQFREEMIKRSYLKQAAVASIIEKTVSAYKPVLNKTRVDQFYEQLPDLSKHIVDALPDTFLTLDEAERLWEKGYLGFHLEQNRWNISATARKIGIRYETLHRKTKELGLKEGQYRISSWQRFG